MYHESLRCNKKISLFFRRYASEPKWLSKLIDQIKEDLSKAQPQNIEQIREYLSIIRGLENRNIILIERKSAMYVGGSVATVQLSIKLNSYISSPIVFNEHFEPNELLEYIPVEDIPLNLTSQVSPLNS